MSAQAGTVPRRGISLDSRLRATARSEWIKFRSVRSGPFALSATALTVVVGAWLLGDANRGSYLAASPAGQAAFDPVFTVLQGISLAQLFIGALGVLTATGAQPPERCIDPAAMFAELETRGCSFSFSGAS